MNRDEVEERLRAAYKNGVSLQSICNKTGLKLGRVASIIPKEGERNPYRAKARLSDKEVAAINSAIDEIKAAL
jgi:hypothetical protein